MDSQRCPIPEGDTLFQTYHDDEWGMPVADEQRIFEKICLEGFQSGLSWRTILHRRPYFRDAFDNFDFKKVASYGEDKVSQLNENSNIIRNKRKILSAINNANRAIELQLEFGSLAAFFWQFEPTTEQRPELVDLQWLSQNTKTPESVALSQALKKRGWSFVGPVNMYALMQALGIVNDHVEFCPARNKVERTRAEFQRPV